MILLIAVVLLKSAFAQQWGCVNNECQQCQPGALCGFNPSFSGKFLCQESGCGVKYECKGTACFWCDPAECTGQVFDTEAECEQICLGEGESWGCVTGEGCVKCQPGAACGFHPSFGSREECEADGGCSTETGESWGCVTGEGCVKCTPGAACGFHPSFGSREECEADGGCSTASDEPWGCVTGQGCIQCRPGAACGFHPSFNSRAECEADGCSIGSGLGAGAPPGSGSGGCANKHDNDGHCESWARNGHCDIHNPEWMALHCAKSCGAC